MSQFKRTEATFLIGLLGVPLVSFGMQLTQATKDFLSTRLDAVVYTEAGRISAIQGTGLTQRINTQTAASDFLTTFLAQPVIPPSTATNLDAITGYTGVQLVFDREDLVGKHPLNPANPKFRVVRLHQEVGGLVVHGSLFSAVFFLQGATETVPLFNVRVVPPPAIPLPGDVVSSDDAINVVSNHPKYDHLMTFNQPELVVYQTPDLTLHRTWRFYGTGSPNGHEGYLFFVDTYSGALVGVVGAVDHSVQGRVTGVAVDGLLADGPWTQQPLPGVEVRALAGVLPVCPTESGMVLETTFSSNDYDNPLMLGDYSIGASGPLRVVGRLTSDRVTIHDCSEISSFMVCDGAADLPPGAWLPTDLLVCEDNSQGSPVNLVFHEGADYPPDTAQVTIYDGLQRTYDWFHGLQTRFTGVDDNLVALANYPGSCNAFFDFVAGFFGFDRASGACRNFGLSRTVISHEYGHAIVRAILGFGVQQDFNEGIADALSAYLWDASLHSENTRTCPGYTHPCASCCQTWGRDLDPDPVDPDPFPSSVPEVKLGRLNTLPCWCNCPPNDPDDSPHCRSLALSQALWDMRDHMIADLGEAAGKATADQLLSDFLFVSDGHMNNAALHLMISDDVDGSLQNGTPNTPAIVQSFIFRHGWGPVYAGISDGTVHVEWFGPISGPPIEGTDYFVYYNVNPPTVVLRTTEVGEDTVMRWIVRRYDVNDEPLDLGTVTAEWDDVSDNDIRVEIGNRLPEDPLQRLRCKNLQAVDIPAQSNDRYSSIVLNLAGDIQERVAAQTVMGTCIGGAGAGQACRTLEHCPGGTMCQLPPNFGVGGRVSGSLVGNHIAMDLVGIGIDDLQPGVLTIAHSPLFPLDFGGDVTLDQHPAGSVLDIGYQDRRVAVMQELHGTIHIATLQRVDIEHTGWLGWQGRIEVLGAGVSNGRIEVEDLKGGTITVENGEFAGTMEIARMQPFLQSPGAAGSDPRLELRHRMSGNVVIHTLEPLIAPDPPANPVIEIEELDGVLRVLDDLIGSVTVTGNGTSNGDIIADGAILAQVRVLGSFAGEICGSNLIPGGPLPPNILICNFGLTATICGAPVLPIAIQCCSDNDCGPSEACNQSTHQCVTEGGPCAVVVDCRNDSPNNGCNCMQCGGGTCLYECTKYGNVNCDAAHLVNLDDILCTILGFSNFASCPDGDINPCGGNGTINLDDLLSTLSAFSGANPCGCNQSAVPPLCGSIDP
jgi:hypothetical protein